MSSRSEGITYERSDFMTVARLREILANVQNQDAFIMLESCDCNGIMDGGPEAVRLYDPDRYSPTTGHRLTPKYVIFGRHAHYESGGHPDENQIEEVR